MKQPVIALGSLRMDKGEGLEYAYASIERMSAMKPEYYAYDIICTNTQLKEANQIFPLIKKRILQRNPQLDKDRLGMGITTDFYDRPGAEPILKRLIAAGHTFEDNLLDLNPDREKSWS